jgi:hypothetical protein
MDKFLPVGTGFNSGFGDGQHSDSVFNYNTAFNYDTPDVGGNSSYVLQDSGYGLHESYGYNQDVGFGHGIGCATVSTAKREKT